MTGSLVTTVGTGEFRSLMSTFPTGVSVVTAIDQDGQPWGMTCSSICSVAVDPPTLLICVRRESPTLRAILRLSRFAVNLLHDRARATAELFASGKPNRFSMVRWRDEPASGGPHLIDDAHAVADCRMVRTVAAGDHLVVFGEVYGVRSQALEEPSPLLYGLRRYSSWPAG
jgi:flavin reductase (NADH)